MNRDRGGSVTIKYLETAQEAGAVAAAEVAGYLRAAIQARGAARIVAATGASQLDFLAQLVAEPDVAWSKVTVFHLDEYIGLPAEHPASFRRYLYERLIDRVHPAAAILIDGEAADPQAECRRVGALLAEAPIDAVFAGIGENGHLAFNDPPADFETHEPYIVVTLDAACRRQQYGEGWFASPDDVPAQAISMSIQQILCAQRIFCVVPDLRKSQAVRDCLEGDISPLHPASILRRHSDVTIYLDRDSASLLSHRPAELPGALRL